MTDADRQQIQELRIKGIGYKAISVLLGISRDVVRGYCKRNGLDGDAKVVSLNVEVRQINNLICNFCNKELKQSGRGRSKRFCSEECRRKWWILNQDKRNRKEKSVYTYQCPNCGTEFRCYGNKCRKYCCHDCYIKSRFWKGDEDGI